MRETYEILESLGGSATLMEIRNRAKQLANSHRNVSAELRSLAKWGLVQATPVKRGVPYRASVWKITGKREWNVIT